MPADLLLAAAALALALSFRPWRLLLRAPSLLAPLLATLAILPWLWALPSLQRSPFQLQWSGAVLVLLMLGWPLAVPALLLVGLAACAVSPLAWSDALALSVWIGIVPASFAVLLGALLRRWAPDNPFVYILGRGFLGAVLCLFAAHLLAQVFAPPAVNDPDTVARWLLAWGDGFVTGMLTAIFVAFKPEWLLTWSDARYLREAP